MKVPNIALKLNRTAKAIYARLQRVYRRRRAATPARDAAPSAPRVISTPGCRVPTSTEERIHARTARREIGFPECIAYLCKGA
jgi:hypothetical protein